MSEIPAPPLPQLTLALALALGAVSVIIGAVLLLWGRTVNRATLVVLGVYAGLFLAGPLWRKVPANPTVVRIVAALALAMLGLLLARLVWAALAGAICGGAACLIVLARSLPQLSPDARPVFQMADSSFGAYSQAVGQYVWAGTQAVWGQQATLLLVTCCLAAAAPLIISMLWPQLIEILMTGLLGAVGIVAGLTLAGGQISARLFSAVFSKYYVPVALAAALFIVGVVFQYLGVLAIKRADAQRRAEREERRAQDQKDEEFLLNRH